MIPDHMHVTSVSLRDQIKLGYSWKKVRQTFWLGTILIQLRGNWLQQEILSQILQLFSLLLPFGIFRLPNLKWTVVCRVLTTIRTTVCEESQHRYELAPLSPRWRNRKWSLCKDDGWILSVKLQHLSLLLLTKLFLYSICFLSIWLTKFR